MAFSLFGKRDKPEQQPDQPTTVATVEPQEPKRGFFDRMKQRSPAPARASPSPSAPSSHLPAKLTRPLVGLDTILGDLLDHGHAHQIEAPLLQACCVRLRVYQNSIKPRS